jgi:hypothetical protein
MADPKGLSTFRVFAAFTVFIQLLQTLTAKYIFDLVVNAALCIA